jgi:hypothetical protein
MRDDNWAKKNPPSRNQAGPRVLALARMAIAGDFAGCKCFEHFVKKDPIGHEQSTTNPDLQYNKNNSISLRSQSNIKKPAFLIKTSVLSNVLSKRDHYTDRLIMYFYSFFSGHSFWGLLDWFLPKGSNKP